MNIDDIRLAVQLGNRFAGGHANQEGINDLLRIDEVWLSIADTGAQLIEDYPSDPRGPSCLILSFSQTRPIHAVVAYPAKRYAVQRHVAAIAFLITVYRPDMRPHEWANDYRTRMP